MALVTTGHPKQEYNINVIPGFENSNYSGIPIKGFKKNE
jgi:hypothetical protein